MSITAMRLMEMKNSSTKELNVEERAEFLLNEIKCLIDNMIMFMLDDKKSQNNLKKDGNGNVVSWLPSMTDDEMNNTTIIQDIEDHCNNLGYDCNMIFKHQNSIEFKLFSPFI